MVNGWFIARRMTALCPGTETLAGRLVDGMLEHGRPADLKAQSAFPLPVWVICDLLGVPDSDRDRFSHWSDTMLSPTRYRQDEVDAVQAEFADHMAAHGAAGRNAPSDDLLGELITPTAPDGHRLTDRALVAPGRAPLVAGHETTANTTGKTVAVLPADRRRRESLVADRSRVRSAVGEALRSDANPGAGMPRHLGEDVEVSGTVLSAGTTVVCGTAAADRDETAFDAAGEMTLGRTSNPRLAFGVGRRSCLLQALARRELRISLDVLLRRLPTLDLAVPAEDPRRLGGLAVGGLSDVPVRW